MLSIPANAQDVSLDLAFVTHLDIDLPEQDVFIEREAGSGNVYRVTKGDHNMNAPLYAAADYVPHDPFNPDAVGPYKKGAPLGMTLGQWLKQSGQGTYTCEGGTGTLELTFHRTRTRRRLYPLACLYGHPSTSALHRHPGPPTWRTRRI